MSYVSQFLNGAGGSLGGVASFTAGAAIAQNNLVQLASDGLVYPVVVSDYATEPNSGTGIYDYSASLTSSLMSYQVMNPVNDSAGNIYVFGATSTSSLIVYKYAPTGQPVAEFSLPGTNTFSYYQYSAILCLSNGNLVLLYDGQTGWTFSIINATTMTEVVGPFVFGPSIPGVGLYNLCSAALPSGGFAVVFNTSSGQATVAVYSNSGVLVGSITNLLTSDPATYALPTIYTLSNGNFVVVYIGQDSVPHFEIFNSNCVSVVAPTALWNLASALTGLTFVVSVMPGYFAISSVYELNVPVTSPPQPVYVAVFNNAGVQQGTTLAIPSVAQNNSGFALTNDNNNFWLILPSTTSYLSILQISSGGVVENTYYQWFYNSTPRSLYVTYDGTLNSIVCALTVINPSLAVTHPVLYISLGNMTFEMTGGVIAGTSMIALTDGVVLAIGAGNASAVFGGTIQFYKYTDTAIVGVAKAAAAAGGSVAVDISAGYKQITPLKGSFTKSFTMKTGSNIVGNNGIIVGTVLSQEGI